MQWWEKNQILLEIHDGERDSRQAKQDGIDTIDGEGYTIKKGKVQQVLEVTPDPEHMAIIIWNCRGA